MANAWMHDVGREHGSEPGHLPGGGAPRVVWCVSESDPNTWSARSAARRLHSDGRPAHLVWNPVTGETVQLLPATAAAAGQLTPGSRTDRTREGRVCVLIQVVGRSRRPFTEGPLNGLGPILEWLDSWGIPRRWPAGPPVPPGRGCAERLWAQGGHFGHCQVPGADTDSPGAIDVERLCGGPVPPPRTGQPFPEPTAPRPGDRHVPHGRHPHATHPS